MGACVRSAHTHLSDYLLTNSLVYKLIDGMYVKIYVTYLFTYLYVSVKCPASMGYEMHEGRCMKLYTASVNFENARSQCAEDLGHLYYYKDSVVDMAAVQALLSPMGTWLSLPLPPPPHTHTRPLSLSKTL